MTHQNSFFEIANNFEVLKETLQKSINGGDIRKMFKSPPIEKGPWGTVEIRKSTEETPDKGFNLNATVYHNDTPKDEEMVSIRFFQDKILMCHYFDTALKNEKDNIELVIMPTKQGRCYVEFKKGTAEAFIDGNNNGLLGGILYKGVRNCITYDGKGENNLSVEVKKQLSQAEIMKNPTNFIYNTK